MSKMSSVLEASGVQVEPQEVTVSFNVVIPENVRAELAQVVPKTVERIRELEASGRKYLVLPLLRLGGLGFEAVSGQTQKAGLAIEEKVVPICVGREITRRFEDGQAVDLIDFAYRVTPETHLPLETKGDPRIEKYYQWLEKDEKATQIAQSLQEKEGIEAVLIVDDNVAQGTTLYLTAPKIVQMAFPQAKMETQALFGNPAWLTDIIKATFSDLTGTETEKQMQWRLLEELAKGADDRNEFVSLTLETLPELLAKFGSIIVEQNRSTENPNPVNPAQLLKKRLTDEDLVRLNLKIRNKLREVGASI